MSKSGILPNPALPESESGAAIQNSIDMAQIKKAAAVHNETACGI
jgi:hypothetical protein